MSCQPCVADLAWAAGVFEGEGCFSARSTRDRSLVAKVKMTDEDVVRRFFLIIRVGNVTSLYVVLNKKPIWVWQVGSFEGVQHTIASLWTWLGKRRRARAVQLLRKFHAEVRFPNGVVI